MDAVGYVSRWAELELPFGFDAEQRLYMATENVRVNLIVRLVVVIVTRLLSERLRDPRSARGTGARTRIVAVRSSNILRTICNVALTDFTHICCWMCDAVLGDAGCKSVAPIRCCKR